MTLLTVWMYKRYSASGVLCSVMTVQLVAALLRALTYYTDEIWPVTLGTFLCECTFPFFVYIEQTIVNRWFGENERGLARALMTLALPLGEAISFA